MMTLDPQKLWYTPTHEWASVESSPGGEQIATVGLSEFAIRALTDLVHLELPEPGRQVAAGEPLGEVESVKAVSDVYSPVDGEVLEAHTLLLEDLDTLTRDPYGNGWLVKIRVTDASGLERLLDFAAYQKQCAEEAAE
jgi:glycine cleavage system H protein